MQSKYDFFFEFVQKNGFDFNQESFFRNPESEFERLAEFMDWGPKALAKNKEQFLLSLNSPDNFLKSPFQTISNPTPQIQNNEKIPKNDNLLIIPNQDKIVQIQKN